MKPNRNITRLQWKLAFRAFRVSQNADLMTEEGTAARFAGVTTMRTVLNQWELPTSRPNYDGTGPAWVKLHNGTIRRMLNRRYEPSAAFQRWMRQETGNPPARMLRTVEVESLLELRRNHPGIYSVWKDSPATRAWIAWGFRHNVAWQSMVPAGPREAMGYGVPVEG